MSLSPLCPPSPWLCPPPPEFVPLPLTLSPSPRLYPPHGLCPPCRLCPPLWNGICIRQSTKSPEGQFAIIVIVIRGNIRYLGLRTALALSTASLVQHSPSSGTDTVLTDSFNSQKLTFIHCLFAVKKMCFVLATFVQETRYKKIMFVDFTRILSSHFVPAIGLAGTSTCRPARAFILVLTCDRNYNTRCALSAVENPKAADLCREKHELDCFKKNVVVFVVVLHTTDSQSFQVTTTGSFVWNQSEFVKVLTEAWNVQTKPDLCLDRTLDVWLSCLSSFLHPSKRILGI